MSIKHNDYGSVQSLKAEFGEETASVGIFGATDITFTPEQYEHVTILKGRLQVNASMYGPGESFDLNPGKSVRFCCEAPVAYFCEYSDTPFSDES